MPSYSVESPPFDETINFQERVRVTPVYKFLRFSCTSVLIVTHDVTFITLR